MSRALDIMTESPTTIPVTATVGDAVQLLQLLEVRHLPVVNAKREVVGMLSDRDLRSLSVPELVNAEWLGEFRVALEAPVTRAMSSDVLAVQEETETGEIIELMLEHRVGALPVMDCDGYLVGIVSYVDVLRELADLEAEAAQ
jgi:CBS-domain-containing membrane protein